MSVIPVVIFFFQAEDGIRYLVRSRGLGDVYKRQFQSTAALDHPRHAVPVDPPGTMHLATGVEGLHFTCLLYTSDAADERSSVDLGGRRIIKKKKSSEHSKRTISPPT